MTSVEGAQVQELKVDGDQGNYEGTDHFSCMHAGACWWDGLITSVARNRQILEALNYHSF